MRYYSHVILNFGNIMGFHSHISLNFGDSMGYHFHVILNFGNIMKNIPILFSTLGLLWDTIPTLFSTLGITWESIPMIFTILGLGSKQHFFPKKIPVMSSWESTASQKYPNCEIPCLSFFPIIGNFEKFPVLGNMDICETTLCKKSFFCPFVWVVHFLINQ